MLTIDYIRGYFDGEGCIFLGKSSLKKPIPDIAIQISTTDHDIIAAIHETLTAMGFPSRLTVRNSPSMQRRGQQVQHCVAIWNRAEVRRFYAVFGTDSRKHRARFERAFAVLDEIDALLAPLRAERDAAVLKARQLRGEGLSLRQIASALGVSVPTASNYVYNSADSLRMSWWRPSQLPVIQEWVERQNMVAMPS